MTIAFKTNGHYTDRSLTEFYFGKAFVAASIKAARKAPNKEYRIWQDGTGYLTVIIY